MTIVPKKFQNIDNQIDFITGKGTAFTRYTFYYRLSFEYKLILKKNLL